MTRRPRWVVVIVVALGSGVQGQSPSPRAAAAVDLTGYWVSLVTTEWRYRMMTPPKGDYTGIPMTAAARAAADAWDPAKDTAAGEQCRAYGAPAIMHVPTRLHITWADDATLRVDIDQGTQTRLFQFSGGDAIAGPRTWQGQSTADWQRARPSTGAGPPSTFPPSSSLRVVTSNLRPGYIRRNGVPYGERALLTEYFDVVPGVRGDEWLIVTTKLEDPDNLQQPLLRSVQFRKEGNGSLWSPTPCVTTW